MLMSLVTITGVSHGLIGDILGGAFDGAGALASSLIGYPYYDHYYYYGYPYYDRYYYDSDWAYDPYWGGYYNRPWRSGWYGTPHYDYEYDSEWDDYYDWD